MKTNWLSIQDKWWRWWCELILMHVTWNIVWIMVHIMIWFMIWVRTTGYAWYEFWITMSRRVEMSRVCFCANMIPAAEARPSPQRCPAAVWTQTRCDDHRDDVGGTQRLPKRFDKIAKSLWKIGKKKENASLFEKQWLMFLKVQCANQPQWSYCQEGFDDHKLRCCTTVRSSKRMKEYELCCKVVGEMQLE